MTDWLSEIEQRQKDDYESQPEGCLVINIDMDKCIEDGERMARVLRELVEVVKCLRIEDGYMFEPINLFEMYGNLSDDAKELLK